MHNVENSGVSTQSNSALPVQAQLAEERGRRGALDAEARTKREAFTEQQAIARADAERLTERLRTAEKTAEASEKAASDLKAQLHVGSPSLLRRPLHIAGSRDEKAPDYRPQHYVKICFIWILTMMAAEASSGTAPHTMIQASSVQSVTTVTDI